MRQERRSDARVVGDQVALGEAGLGEQDLVPVGELQRPAVDGDRQRAVGTARHGTEQRLGGRAGVFADDLRGGLVVAQPLERRRAHHAVTGPFAELDLGDQLGADVDGVARQLGRRVKGRRVGAQGLQPCGEVVEGPLGEPGADPARVPQRAGGGWVRVDAHEQRADPVRAPALAGQPAADHQLLAADVLELDPRPRAPSGLIARVPALGHHALQALGGGRLQELAGRSGAGGRHAPRRAAERELLQPGAALCVGQADQRAPVEVQQVEDRVHDRRRLRQALDRARRGDVHPALETLEARGGRVDRVVEGDDLAVEQRLAHPEVAQDPADLGVGVGDLR